MDCRYWVVKSRFQWYSTTTMAHQLFDPNWAAPPVREAVFVACWRSNLAKFYVHRCVKEFMHVIIFAGFQRTIFEICMYRILGNSEAIIDHNLFRS